MTPGDKPGNDTEEERRDAFGMANEPKNRIT